MAENEAVETATTEEGMQAVETAEQNATSAETETTETATHNAADEENRIPYVRFNKVVRERNEAREREAEKDRQIAELRAELNGGAETVDAADDTRAQARKMIEEDSRALLEREFGMSLSEIKSRIAATDNYGQDYVERKWADQCSQHKLDPADKDIQAFVGGLVNYEGIGISDALKRAAKRFAPQGRKDTASVEEVGVAGTMTRSDQVVWDAKSAADLAKKGIRSPDVGIMDIINKRRAKPS
jgi:hypothetical protein